MQNAQHPHFIALQKFYAAFAQGDLQAAVSACADSVTFQVPGKSPLAGKYDRKSIAQDLGIKLRELSGNTFQFEAHDILVSDLHATVLGSIKITRSGKSTELRTVHVWRFENGKPLAGYEYPRDLYQYDSCWS